MTDTASNILDFNTAARASELRQPLAAVDHEVRLERLRLALTDRADALVRDIFPRARIHAGEARIGDIEGGPGESLAIALQGDRAGLWTDHATGQGGDLIELWKATTGATFATAVDDLERWAGIVAQPAWAPNPVRKMAERRATEAAKEPTPSSNPLGPPVKTWHYLSAEGAILGKVSKYLLTNGDKTYRPFNAAGEMRPPDPRPLYRIPEIRTANTVILTEGEKCADALASLGFEATSAMGGANALIEKTDWSPLAGKTVLLWPDNDAPGREFMDRVRPALEAIGCAVSVIAIGQGRPEKWDAADAVEAGEDIAEIIGPRPTSSDAQGEKFKFNVTFFEDIPDEHHKTWLVEDLFGTNEFTIVYGAPGCGKSVLIGDAAAHVAAGIPWFGRATRRCSVLYVAAERHALVKRRLAAWRRTNGILATSLVVLDGLFNLATDPSHATEIARIAVYVEARTGLPVGWIIVDTKAQVMGGGDENASKDISILNNNIALLQATGAHVTVIDHTPQADPTRMKGNGGLAGAADGSFLVQKKGATRSLSVGSKAPNDGPDDIEITFALESVVLGVNDEGKETKAPIVVPATAEATRDTAKMEPAQRLGPIESKILTAMGRAATAGQSLRFMRLKMMIGGDHQDSAIDKAITRLVEKGKIVKSGEGYLLP